MAAHPYPPAHYALPSDVLYLAEGYDNPQTGEELPRGYYALVAQLRHELLLAPIAEDGGGRFIADRDGLLVPDFNTEYVTPVDLLRNPIVRVTGLRARVE